MLNKTLFLLLLLGASLTKGQNLAELARQQYPQNAPQLETLREKVFAMPQDSAYHYIANLQKQAKEKKLINWVLGMDFLKIDYNQEHHIQTPNDWVQEYRALLQRATDKEIIPLQVVLLFKIAHLEEGKLDDYKSAIADYTKLKQLLLKIPYKAFPLKLSYMVDIGIVFYRFKNYKTTLRYLQKAVSLPVTLANVNKYRSGWNTIGLIYQKLHQPDSALYCFQKVIQIKVGGRSEQWEGIAKGNIGHTYYLQGRYNEAIPLLKYDDSIALKYKDYRLFVGSGILLADIYVRQNKLKKADYYIQACLQNIKRSEPKQKRRLRLLYPVMAKYYIQTQQPQKAQQYIDSTLVARQRYNRKYNTIFLLQANQKEAQRKAELMRAQKRAEQKRNIFILLAVVLIFSIIMIWRSRQHINQRHRLSENFSRQLIREREKARKHIAAELHDGAGQQLTLLKKKADRLHQKELSKLAQEILNAVRSLSHRLYPPVLEKIGLTEALKQLVFNYDEETNIFFTTEIGCLKNCLTQEDEVVLYRFIQEALNNIAKHAEAKAAFVTVTKREKHIFVKVSDNGKGFDSTHQNKNGIGLKTLQERISILKGRMTFKSSGGGTKIIAIIPLTYEK